MLSSSRRKDAETPRYRDAETFNSPSRRVTMSPRLLALLLTAHCLLLTSSCRRDMQDQPKTVTYRESSFYKDGTGSRPLLDGTVPRGYLREDREYYLGKKAITASQSGTSMTQPAGAQATAPSINVPTAEASATNPYPDDVDTFPFPITKKMLDEGEERYNIYCSVCHGMTGYGDGIVARRGFNRPSPANYHQDRLRQAPVGHFFDVMTNGWGAMPSYVSQVSVEDRWKIAAYIRALQLSQMPKPVARDGAREKMRGSRPTVKEGSNP